MRNLYVETSVFGGVFEEESAEDCARLFRQAAAGKLHLCTSAVVEEELEAASPLVRRYYLGVLPGFEYLQLSNAAVQLFLGYLQLDVVPLRFMPDAMHVALATVAGCGAVVSLNMRHLANLERIEAFNAYNSLRGYNQIDIRTPGAVVYERE